MRATLAQILPAIADAKLAFGDAALAFDGVSTDSRTVAAGALFVALRGEVFDAHDFLAQVAEKRVAAVVAEQLPEDWAATGVAAIVVPNTLTALGQIANYWRKQYAVPVIGVTGSNGKTTVKEMISAILAAAHGEEGRLATRGNLNNEIGVPLTLFRMAPEQHSAVIEMGMNHPGEIARLAAIAAPTIAMVNNAQREHQEFMATVEAVARENGAALEALPADGVAIFPAIDDHAAVWQGQAGTRRCMRFALAETPDGVWPDAEVAGRARWVDGAWLVELHTPAGEATLQLHVAGRHNVRNALAAAAATLGAGVALGDVARGLAAFVPVKGRSQVRALTRDGHARTLIDDTYNANPDSVRAGIEVLADLPGPRWLVLGDMGEVGDQGPAFHREIGAYARERGIEHAWFAGVACQHAAQAYGPGARHFADTSSLLALLATSRRAAPAFESALIKGSRFMGMERVVALLVEHDTGGDTRRDVHAA